MTTGTLRSTPLSMRYEEFKAVWEQTLRDTGLAVFSPSETLDLRNMSRTCEAFAEPIGGQGAPPFFVTAKLGFRWQAIHTARAATTEEDFLVEIFGREKASKARTERPWIRADISFKATLQYGKPIPMPTKRVWEKWFEETMARLEEIERLSPDEVIKEKKDGLHEILAWADERPTVETECDFDGDLLLTGVELQAWEGIKLPRVWDDPSRRPDPHPQEQLRKMFERVRSSLHAWMEVMDHLR